MYFPIISTVIVGIKLCCNYINKYNAYSSYSPIVSPGNQGGYLFVGEKLAELGLENVQNIYGMVAAENLSIIGIDSDQLEKLAGTIYNPLPPIFFDFSYKGFSIFTLFLA